jgi:hypothetical protein
MRVAVGDDADLAASVATVADTIDFLLVDIQVKGATLRDGSKQVGPV